jgi:WD40 repeat protein
VGQVLKQRYELLHELGRGAFAVTHLARDRVTGQHCVAKLLSFTRERSPRALELFEREARVLANLRHPRVPRFVEFFTEETADDVVAVLVQEHLEGADLARRVRDRGPCSEAEAIAIGRQVAAILEHLHGFRPPILHRDVKPSNVLLAPDGSAWLIDFGAVRDTLLHDPLLVPGGPTVVGTFGYMAPEQFQGEAAPASDVYGLAATLTYALSGLEPWELDKQEMRPVLRPRIPASEPLLRVLERALDPDPRRRYASARAFREGLETVADRPAALAGRTAVRGGVVIAVAWTAALWLLVRPHEPTERRRSAPAPAIAPRGAAERVTKTTVEPQPSLRPSVPWPPATHDEAGEPVPPGVLRRLGTRRLRHGGPVRAVAFTPDGRTVVSGGEDGIVSLWEAATGASRQTLATYAPVVALAVSEDGRRLGTGLGDASVRVFALPGGRPLARFQLGRDEGTFRLAIAFPGGDRDRVATASPRGTLDLWSLSSRQAHQRQVTACTATPWALDGRPGRIEIGCGHEHLAVDPATGAVTARVALSRTGDRLVRQQGGGWWSFSDAEAWRLDSSGRVTEESFRLHGTVTALAVSADGRVGAAGLADGTRVVFDAVRGVQQRVLEGHAGPVLAVALSADGRRLASGGSDHTVRVADLVAGTELEGPGLRHAVEALAFSASGGSLFSGSADGQFLEWGNDGRPRAQQSLGGAVNVVAPLDRSQVVVGERPGVGRNEPPHRLARLRVFAGSAALRELALPANASGYAIATPAERFATATATHGHTWSLADGRHASWVTPARERPVALSPNGRVLATARDEGDFAVSLVLRDADSGRELRRMAFGRGGPGIGPCRGADGSFLLASGSLFRVANASPPRVEYAGAVGGGGECAVSPDGKQVATAVDDHIQWRAVRSEEVGRGWEMWRQAWLDGHRGRVTALAFSPDGRLLATGGVDTQILVWDLKAIASALGDERPQVAPLWPPLPAPPHTAAVTIDFDEPERGVTPWHARPNSAVPEPVLRGRALDTRTPRVYPEGRDVRLGDAWSIAATFRFPAAAFPLPPYFSLLRSEALYLYVHEGAARLVLGFLNQGGHAAQDLTAWTGALKPDHDYHLVVNYDRARGGMTICVDAACAPGPAGLHFADRLGELLLGERDPKGHAFALLDDVRILARERTDAEIARAAGRAETRARDAEARP